MTTENGRIKQDDIDLIANMMDGMMEVKLEEKLEPIRTRLDRLDSWTEVATKQFNAITKLTELTSQRLDHMDKRFDRIDEFMKAVAEHVEITNKHMDATDKRLEMVAEAAGLRG